MTNLIIILIFSSFSISSIISLKTYKLYIPKKLPIPPSIPSSLKTEILLIKNNGDTKYTITEKGYPQPDIRSNIDEKNLDKIKALIKETGFIAIPSNSFSIFENVTDYQKSSVKITLNGQVNQIHWPETNATPDFIPPIIAMVESELDKIMSEISE